MSMETAVVNASDVRAEPILSTLVPRGAAEQLQAVPVELIGDVVTMAMLDPNDVFVIDELQRITGKRIRAVGISAPDLRAVMAKVYSASNMSAGPSEMMSDNSKSNTVMLGGTAVSPDAPTIVLLNNVLEQAIHQRASDIHIEPYENQCLVRFRIDGVLYDFRPMNPEEHIPLISRIKILANIDIAEHRLPLDGRFSISLVGKRWDVRVSTVPTQFGEKAVLRILAKDATTISLEELGMLERERRIFEGIISKPHGMLLVTGPTGSGKTTTLYTALRSMDTVGRNIITIEDPVEYELPRVSQIQVHSKIGLTFAAALRSVLRQDPDVVMVGEIRDIETLGMAVQAALTGHFVFSTLHCNDSVSAATRATDMGLEPFLFTSSVIGVVAQRLVRKICPLCRVAEPLPEVVRQRLGITDPNAATYRGKGCKDCRHTGYRGRVGVYELLSMNDNVRTAIQERRSASEIRKAAVATGMVALRDDALRKVLSGVTTLEEVLRAVYLDN
ncbi:MAG: ral secretion pathway protein GspE [Armatimonadetes bacterium]|jgi:type II secretory ATPase GspE/PulE/Tfp pilus assembly ATPase PilB-like protein|nr:ral secretion pathway protein GspE [Armatimonadota bacterium]